VETWAVEKDLQQGIRLVLWAELLQVVPEHFAQPGLEDSFFYFFWVDSLRS
jgi:hypothetical protein